MHSPRTQTLRPDDQRQDLRGQLEVKREELMMPQVRAGPDLLASTKTPMRALPLDDSAQLFQCFDHQAVSAPEDDFDDIHYEGIMKEKQASMQADRLLDSRQMWTAAN